MKNSVLGIFIIASAIIFGLLLLMCSIKLKGTDCYQTISTILSMGFVAHLLFIWGPLTAIVKRQKRKMK